MSKLIALEIVRYPFSIYWYTMLRMIKDEYKTWYYYEHMSEISSVKNPWFFVSIEYQTVV